MDGLWKFFMFALVVVIVGLMVNPNNKGNEILTTLSGGANNFFRTLSLQSNTGV